MNVQPLSTALKCFDMLEVLTRQSRSVRISELARLLAESRATTYQRLVTLQVSGWVERLPDGSYRLSTLACRVAAAALNQAGFEERAQAVLEKLAGEFGEAASLVMLERDSIIITRRAEALSILRTDLRVGTELDYKDSSSGGIWLAFGPHDLADRLRKLGRKLPSRTRIEAVRAQRVSVGGGGRTLAGISAIAVPVLTESGQCLASLSISSPDSRFKPARYLSGMRNAAKQLTSIATLHNSAERL